MTDSSPYQSTTQQILGQPSYDARAHYERICETFRNHPLNTDERARQYGRDLLSRILNDAHPNALPNDAIIDALADIITELFVDNFIYVDAPPAFEITGGDRDYLTVLERQYDPRRIQPASQILATVLRRLLTLAPTNTFSDHSSSLACQLIDILPKPATVITYAIGTLSSARASDDEFVFPSLYNAYRDNIARASSCTIEQIDTHKLVFPDDSKLPGAELARAYLENTPFLQLFLTPVPFALPDEQRFSGHWVIAPPGRGKTTLLHSMFLDDLSRDASIIVMDSKGDLINPIKQLAAVKDRLLLIEPDPDYPLALNPLDIPKTNVAHTVSLLEYVFSALLEAKMTALQMTLFRSVLPALVEVVPNATLETFRDVIENGAGRYKEHIDKLSPDLKDFFTRQFDSKTYIETRQQLVWRLQFLMTNPIIKQMFSALKTRLDIGKEMDAGKVILIDNGKLRLGDEGSEFFGRFFIALVLAAAQQRAGRPYSRKLPCYFYIDECQNVVRRDEKISTILDECRSQKIAMIMAHQRTAQITSANVLDALSNCAIRMANSDDEAKYLSEKLRTDTDTLRSLPRGTFATFVRDLTPTGITLKVPYTDLSKLPRMTAAEQQGIRDHMREQFSFTPQSARTAAAPVVPPQADEPVAGAPEPPSTPPPSDPHTGDHTKPATKW